MTRKGAPRKLSHEFLVLISIPLTIVFATSVKAQDVPVEIVDGIQKSVVPIVCMKANRNGAEIQGKSGTGFFINRDGYFLTVAHVIRDLRSTCPAGSAWAIGVPKAPWKKRQQQDQLWFQFNECRYDETADAAACKPTRNPFADIAAKANLQPARLGTLTNHPDGTAVAFTGFPMESPVPVTSKGFIATYFPIENWIGIDKPSWPAGSGSPIYDAKGDVIGILIKRGVNEGAGMTFARPIDTVVDFLRKEKIPFEK